jgi:hypothetical protein
LTLERGRRLARVELNNALWTQAGGSLILGGLCMFLAYVGKPRIKVVVCASAIAAIWLVHKRPVSPFGNLLGYRPPAHLLDPALTPLRTALEAEKARRLHLVGLGWLALVSGSTAAGVLHPPKLTAILAVGEGIEQLAAWPLFQGVAEWALLATIIGTIAVTGSAFVLWFAIYLLILLERPRL